MLIYIKCRPLYLDTCTYIYLYIYYMYIYITFVFFFQYPELYCKDPPLYYTNTARMPGRPGKYSNLFKILQRFIIDRFGQRYTAHIFISYVARLDMTADRQILYGTRQPRLIYIYRCSPIFFLTFSCLAGHSKCYAGNYELPRR